MRRTVQAMLVVAIAIDLAYWSIWFTDRDVLASEHTQGYYDFENAFPLADAWLGLVCVLALVAVTRRTASAPFWLACAGSAGMYLCGMDLLYDLEHGILASGGGGAIEALIVTLTLVFSITALRYAWGDMHAGRTPHIVAAGYTYNQRDDKLTTNYAIDAALGTLVLQGSREGTQPMVSPNTGQLRTVGSLGLGPLEDASFDIADVNNTALLAARTGAHAPTVLYRVDLDTGRARALGVVGDGAPLRGLAIVP